jgi:phosphoserine phosphatase
MQLLSLSGMTEADCVKIYQFIDEQQLNLIDLHQGAVYDRHSLNLLLYVPPDKSQWWEEQLAGIEQYAQSRKISLSLNAVSDDAYQSWLAGRGKPHYIMTILSEGLSPKFLSAMRSALSAHGMSIDTVQRLSGYGDPSQRTKKSQPELFAVQLMLRGDCENERNLRMEVLMVGEQLGLNVGIQRDTIYRRHRRLLVMDMDSTLIESEAIDELARAKGSATAEAVQRMTQQAMDGDLSFSQSLRKRVRLLEGISQETLDAVGEKLPLRKGARSLYRELHKLGYTTAIISGGFDCFANILKKQLDIDKVYANSLEIRGGKLTGALVGDIIDRKAKGTCLKKLVNEMGINIEQSIAVGDGANDIEMISRAGLGIAYHPSRTMLMRYASHTFKHIALDGILYLIGLRSYEVENKIV